MARRTRIRRLLQGHRIVGWFSWLRFGKRNRADDFGDGTIEGFGFHQAQNRTASSVPRFHETGSGIFRRTDIDPSRKLMRTAFTPSQPVSDIAMFAGRREILVSAIRAIEDQQLHVLLYGDRGIGKTSMLHVLSYLARESGYLVRYYSCGQDSGFDDTFRTVARDVPLIYYDEIDPGSDAVETGGSLADLLPPGELSVSQLSEAFAKIKGTRLLIILDEFDRTESPQFRRGIAELIKNLSDRSTRVQLVITGVAANLAELLEHIPSIRRNIFGLPVPNMTGEEVRNLVDIGAQTSGLSYPEDTTDAIVFLANGSPYLASLLGQHAGIAALDRDSRTVTEADVAVAVDRALVEVEQRVLPKNLHQIRQISDPRMKALLRGFAQEALANIGQIERGVLDGGGTPMERARALEQLDTQYHLLRQAPDQPGGGYEFREDGVALYLWLSAAKRDAEVAGVTA